MHVLRLGHNTNPAFLLLHRHDTDILIRPVPASFNVLEIISVGFSSPYIVPKGQ